MLQSGPNGGGLAVGGERVEPRHLYRRAPLLIYGRKLNAMGANYPRKRGRKGR